MRALRSAAVRVQGIAWRAASESGFPDAVKVLASKFLHAPRPALFGSGACALDPPVPAPVSVLSHGFGPSPLLLCSRAPDCDLRHTTTSYRALERRAPAVV